MGYQRSAVVGFVALFAVVVVLIAACSSDDSTDAETATAPAGEDDVTLVESACPTEGEEWEEARLYIEHNATDEDTGVHGFFGGEAWREMCIWDPKGEQILFAEPLAQFKELGISDLFWESREPEADEFPVADLLADFPEGDYVVGGTDFEGTPRVGVAVFTHDIPVEPNITNPVLAEDPETVDGSTVPASGLVVTWDPVTETLAGDAAVIAAYEVIITTEEYEDPNAWSQPIYDVHVPAEVNSLAVPDEFLQPATIYELEILAIEESGNQTIALGFFVTE